jgi:hypothetical protein
VALTVAEGLKAPSQSLVAVNEGAEPEEFWAAIGGQAEYPKTKVGNGYGEFRCFSAFSRIT